MSLSTLSDPPPHSFSTASLSQTPPTTPIYEPVSAASTCDRTHVYIESVLSTPVTTLASSSMRFSFLTSLLGEVGLANTAMNDAPLLAQLQSRTAALLRQITLLQPTATPHAIALYLSLLVTLATQWPVLLATFETCNVTLLLHTVLTSRPSLSVLLPCLVLLRACTVTDTMRKRVMYDSLLPPILAIMNAYPNNARVQDVALCILANLSFGCAHRKRKIARQNAIVAITKAMSNFPRDEQINLRACLAIRNLTHQTQVNQFIAGNQRAVEHVVAVLLRFRGAKSSPQLRFQAVLALESLCKEDERNRQRVFDIESAPKMEQVLKKCVPLQRDKQAERGKLPQSAAQEQEERVNEHGDVVVDEEEVILSYDDAHFRHGEALCPGRSSTTLFTSPSVSSSAGSDKPPSSVMLKDEFGQKDEENATSNHTTSSSKPSVLRSVIHIMRRDPDDAMLLESGITLLTLVALNRPDAQVRIGNLGAVQLSIAAMRRHRKNDMLVSRACALIRCLCLQSVNRAQVTSGLPVLISAVSDHCNDADVVREIAAALSNAVFEHEKNRAWVVNKGGVSAIVKALKHGEKDVMLLEAGICALRNFVDSSYSGAVSAANEGAIRTARDALDSTKEGSTRGQRIVLEQAVLFLVELSRLAPQTVQNMRELDVEDWIENALAKLPQVEYPHLHELGDKLINSLSYQNENNGKFGCNGKSNASGHASPGSTGLSDRSHTRGFFGSLLLTKRRRYSGHNRKRLLGRSAPIDADSRSKRISGRFMKAAARSHA